MTYEVVNKASSEGGSVLLTSRVERNGLTGFMTT